MFAIHLGWLFAVHREGVVFQINVFGRSTKQKQKPKDVIFCSCSCFDLKLNSDKLRDTIYYAFKIETTVQSIVDIKY